MKAECFGLVVILTVFFFFFFRLPWLHQWIFSQLHGVFSLCCKLVQLTYYHIIPVTLNKEAYVFWHVLLAQMFLTFPSWSQYSLGACNLFVFKHCEVLSLTETFVIIIIKRKVPAVCFVFATAGYL